MELTKEQMELVIGWLEDHYWCHNRTDTEQLLEVVTKFQTYLKGGKTK
tara:strand:+ start:274 stop:417 length:144 start_codon:yes stop_codon:yes gene_type:complete